VEHEPEIVEEEEAAAEPVPKRSGLSSVALTVTIVCLVLWFSFQAFQLVRDRGNLRLVKANQESAMQESEKVQVQFKTLMTKIAALANQGHGGAKMVMDELQKRGVGFAPQEKSPEKPESKTKTK
jgi:flagellar basal body-associated protein FliL